MFKLSRVATLLAALLPAAAMAQSIEGVVKDSKGNVVAGARVEIEGTNLKTVTDSNGQFRFQQVDTGEQELHIVADGYAHLHQDIDISNEQLQKLQFELGRSPIEVFDVVATPIHMSVMESAAPVSVLAGDTLRRQQAATLGDSLESLPGVHSNFHANVASTPVIRGLSGPRVLIAQNGLDVSDVSRVGPDHSVAAEASTSQQIEVLRGPATLFYGSGAIGGVVNVVDGRVPTDNTTRGEWLLESDSVNDQTLASFNMTTGADAFALYVDGYLRDSDDYDVPVAPELDEPDSQERVVANSAEESDGFTLGASYLFDQGYVGVSVEQFNREYGIPGHSHGGEEEEDVFADLEQTRVQLLSEINFENSWINRINTRAAFTEYEHAEIEHGFVGTTFNNDTEELRIDLMHDTFAGWNGGVSFHYKNSEIAAQGSEAFTPPSKAETLALAIMEEKHFGDVLVQLGARVERVTLQADRVLLPMIDAHGHDEEHEDEHDDHDDHDHDHDHGHDDHDHEDELSITRVFSADHEFTPVSVSAGLVWDFTPGYNVALSLSSSQRAPSASELLSFGPHIGTRTYEVGALFALHQEDGEMHLELTDEQIDLETANNIDVTFRKTEGDVGIVLNAFYNRVDNYYYQINTGLFAEDGHDHGHDEHDHDEHDHDEHDHDEHDHDEHDEHDHAGELPVYLFQADDVILHGFEAQIAWQATDNFKATFTSDYVRARLQDGGDLPRTPPMRFGTQLSYQKDSWNAHLDITRYQSQDRIAAEETKTDGYTLVDANVSYDFSLAQQDMSVYLKVTNLTDTEARVHTSFLKDLAPRPGRSFAIGVRGQF